MPLETFTDLAVARDAEGIYDLGVDPDVGDADAALTQGLASAIFVSLFSDRRARSDEVASPMLRRGWIGNLVSDVPGDNFGSGLWLYEQSRLTQEVAAAVAGEARNALQWMVDDELCSSLSVTVTKDQAARSIMLNVTINLNQGGVSQHAFVLASATEAGLLARL